MTWRTVAFGKLSLAGCRHPGCGQDRRFFCDFSMRMIQMEFRVQNLSGLKHSGYTSRRCTASGRREHFRAWSDASCVRSSPRQLAASLSFAEAACFTTQCLGLQEIWLCSDVCFLVFLKVLKGFSWWNSNSCCIGKSGRSLCRNPGWSYLT